MNRGAFTLVEVMIALLIISIVLVALSMSQGFALNSARKGRFVTMATLAAKNMMADIDITSTIKGYSYIKELGEKTEGEFDNEEYIGWKWVREVKEVKFPISEIMKSYLGADNSDELGGTDTKQATDNSKDAQILNMISNNVETFMKNSVREVTVTVMWPVRGGKEFSSLKLVYYAVDNNGVENFVPVI